jgi:hypothetical protein
MSTVSRRDFVQAGATAGLALASSPAAGAVEVPAGASPTPWIVMVYLAGDNSLSEDMVLALQDLLAEELPGGSRIVAQFDPSGVGLAAQRYVFYKGFIPRQPLEHYRVKDFDALEINTGSREAWRTS